MDSVLKFALPVFVLFVGLFPSPGRAVDPGASERAIVVVGESEPWAWIGINDRVHPIGGEHWILFDTLAQWLVQRNGTPQNVPGGRRLRVLLVGVRDDYRLPRVDDFATDELMFFFHLRHGGHSIETVRSVDFDEFDAADLRRFDLVVTALGSNSTMPLQALRKSGTAFITSSRRMAIELGLIVDGGSGGRAQRGVVPVDNGPFARLGTEVDLFSRPTWVEPRQAGPQGRPALLPPSDFDPALASGSMELPEDSGRALIERPGSSVTTTATRSQAASLIVAHDVDPYVYFGLGLGLAFDVEGWCYLDAVVDWMVDEPRPYQCVIGGDGRGNRNRKKRILFFGYLRDFILPFADEQYPSFATATHLSLSGYYVDLRGQDQLGETTVEEFREYDLVVYWATHGYSPTRVIESGVPFLTRSYSHASRLGLGRYDHTFRGDTVCVVDDDSGPFRKFTKGEVSIDLGRSWRLGGYAIAPTVTARSLVEPTCREPDDAHMQDAEVANGSVVRVAASSSLRFGIDAISPNPLRREGSIDFVLTSPGSVRVTVFDLRGRRVRTVLDGQLSAGRHSSVFDSRADSGHSLPSGVYFLRLESGGQTVTRRITVLR